VLWCNAWRVPEVSMVRNKVLGLVGSGSFGTVGSAGLASPISSMLLTRQLLLVDLIPFWFVAYVCAGVQVLNVY